MAPSTIPYPACGQGISFISACLPSHPLDLQPPVSMLLPGSARGHIPSASRANLAAHDRAWVVGWDHR
jgi:hypothetical protein